MARSPFELVYGLVGGHVASALVVCGNATRLPTRSCTCSGGLLAMYFAKKHTKTTIVQSRTLQIRKTNYYRHTKVENKAKQKSLASQFKLMHISKLNMIELFLLFDFKLTHGFIVFKLRC